MTTTQTQGGPLKNEEKSERPAMILLKALVDHNGDLVRQFAGRLIGEYAIAGDMRKVGGLSRLVQELFPLAARVAPEAEEPKEAVKAKEEPPPAAAKGKKQMDLPLDKKDKEEEDDDVEEEEVEDEEVDEEEEEEDDEEEEKETPPPPLKPFSLGGKRKKSKKK